MTTDHETHVEPGDKEISIQMIHTNDIPGYNQWAFNIQKIQLGWPGIRMDAIYQCRRTRGSAVWVPHQHGTR